MPYARCGHFDLWGSQCTTLTYWAVCHPAQLVSQSSLSQKIKSEIEEAQH